MLFQAVVRFLPIMNFLKISCKRGKVHLQIDARAERVYGMSEIFYT